MSNFTNYLRINKQVSKSVHKSEEKKAVERLKEMTKNYSLNSKDLHYANILYYLIINLNNKNQKLQHENQQLKADLTKEELAYSNLRDTYNKKYNECKLYKEVIEEVNNIIKMKKRTLGYDTNDSYLRSIEEILDKVKGVKND